MPILAQGLRTETSWVVRLHGVLSCKVKYYQFIDYAVHNQVFCFYLSSKGGIETPSTRENTQKEHKQKKRRRRVRKEAFQFQTE